MNQEQYQPLIEKIFNAQDEQGFWKVIPESDKYYPDYLHYVGLVDYLISASSSRK